MTQSGHELSAPCAHSSCPESTQPQPAHPG